MNSPTYSKEEAFYLIWTLDIEGIKLLMQVLQEEKKLYSLADLYYLKGAYNMAMQFKGA